MVRGTLASQDLINDVAALVIPLPAMRNKCASQTLSECKTCRAGFGLQSKLRTPSVGKTVSRIRLLKIPKNSMERR